MQLIMQTFISAVHKKGNIHIQYYIHIKLANTVSGTKRMNWIYMFGSEILFT
jgi:hypothetical protein